MKTLLIFIVLFLLSVIGEVIWVQKSQIYTNGIYSGNYDQNKTISSGDPGLYNVVAADDFTIPNGTLAQIESVWFSGFFQNASASSNIKSWTVLVWLLSFIVFISEVWGNAKSDVWPQYSIPDNVIHNETVTVTGTQPSSFNFTLVNPLSLGGGTYWVGMYPTFKGATMDLKWLLYRLNATVIGTEKFSWWESASYFFSSSDSNKWVPFDVDPYLGISPYSFGSGGTDLIFEISGTLADIQAPVVQSAVISSPAVSNNTYVDINVTITDNHAGVSAALCTLSSPDSIHHEVTLSLISGDILNGIWHGVYTFSQDDPLGIWTVTNITTTDISNNVRSVTDLSKIMIVNSFSYTTTSSSTGTSTISTSSTTSSSTASTLSTSSTTSSATTSTTSSTSTSSTLSDTTTSTMSTITSGNVSTSTTEYNLGNNSTPSSSSTTIYAVIGSVIGFVILASIIVGILLWRRRKPSQATEIPMEPTRASTIQAQYLTDIKIMGRLGQGNFGEVFRGMWEGSEVALKKVTEGQAKEFEREANLLCGLQHPNVVRMLGLFIDSQSNNYMVMEMVSKGSLKNLLGSMKGQLTEKEKLEMMSSACRGMVYLEKKNIIHRDLAARNLLISHVDGKYMAKIADFGLSRETNEYKSEGSLIPIRWSAPEVLRNEAATSKSDVFSFGIVMYEIVSEGATPYEFLHSNHQVMEYVLSGKIIPKEPACSNELYELMCQCWNEVPAQRPTFFEVLEKLEKIRGEEVPSIVLSIIIIFAVCFNYILHCFTIQINLLIHCLMF